MTVSTAQSLIRGGQSHPEHARRSRWVGTWGPGEGSLRSGLEGSWTGGTRPPSNRPVRGGFCPGHASSMAPDPATSALFLRNFEDPGGCCCRAGNLGVQFAGLIGSRRPTAGQPPGQRRILPEEHLHDGARVGHQRSVSSEFRRFWGGCRCRAGNREVQFAGLIGSRCLTAGQSPGKGRILPGAYLPDDARVGHQRSVSSGFRRFWVGYRCRAGNREVQLAGFAGSRCLTVCQSPGQGGFCPGHASPMMPELAVSARFLLNSKILGGAAVAGREKREVQFTGFAGSRRLTAGQLPGKGRILPGARLPDGARDGNQRLISSGFRSFWGAAVEGRGKRVVGRGT
jgi:hypothetical protein